MLTGTNNMKNNDFNPHTAHEKFDTSVLCFVFV